MDKLWTLIPSLLISLVGLVLAIDARRHSRKREAQSDWQGKIDAIKLDLTPLVSMCSELKARLQVIELQVSVFWKGVSFSSAQALHSPHRQHDLDPPIEAFQRDQIDNGELIEFKRLLQEIAENEEESAFKRKAALEVLTLIKIRYEIQSEAIEAA